MKPFWRNTIAIVVLAVLFSAIAVASAMQGSTNTANKASPSINLLLYTAHDPASDQAQSFILNPSTAATNPIPSNSPTYGIGWTSDGTALIWKPAQQTIDAVYPTDLASELVLNLAFLSETRTLSALPQLAPQDSLVILAIRDTTDPACDEQLYVVSLSNPTPRRVAAACDPTSSIVGPVQWSPNGTQILFEVAKDDRTAPQFYIYNLPVVTAPLPPNPTPATEGYGHRVVFSPSGTRVLFDAVAEDDDTHHDIYIWHVGDAEPAVLIAHPRHDTAPIWSPDGSQIVFERHSTDSSAPTPSDRDLYIANADGRNVRPLTEGAGDDHSAVWSADGQYLAFVRTIGTTSTLYLFKFASSELMPIVEAPAFATLVWQPAA